MSSLDSIAARLSEARECHDAGADAPALRALVQAFEDMLDVQADLLEAEPYPPTESTQVDLEALRALESMAHGLAAEMLVSIRGSEERAKRGR